MRLELGTSHISLRRTSGGFLPLTLLISALGAAPQLHAAEAAAQLELGRLGLMEGVSTLQGKKVRDVNEHAIGKFDDVMLDLSQGRVLVAMVSDNPENIPLPPAVFHAVCRDKILLNVDRKLVESAPRYSRSKGSDSLSGDLLVGTIRHFGKPVRQDISGSFSVCSGKGLIGKALLSKTGEALGQVQDVMVDLGGGRAVYLVIKPAGPSGDFYPLPPETVRLDAGTLKISTDREHFLRAPHFQKEFSVDIVEADLATKVYRYYGLTGSNELAAQVTATGSPQATASNAQPRMSDTDITKGVVTQIITQKRILLNGGVQIVTTDGRVRLTGTAKNEAERKAMIAAAEEIVGASNVENGLLLKGKNTTAQR
ncbi:MAG TPA: PRC-barrel domain-containing protein [Candidatus Dormibacteraeota bacterium]|nr:PRC-barrel domain-containing protein [Candidatus Dormibacteraeota bacterium]